MIWFELGMLWDARFREVLECEPSLTVGPLPLRSQREADITVTSSGVFGFSSGPFERRTNELREPSYS